MEPLTAFLRDYLTGKSLYSPISRILNFILSVSITSYLFQKIYFTYTLIDITDYKAIYAFFVSGRFFIPLVIFTLVHYVISFVAEVIFTLSTTQITAKWLDRIVNFKVKKKHYNTVFRKVKNNPVLAVPQSLNKSILLKYFEFIKKSVKPEDWIKAQETIKQKKAEINKNFKLVFKAIIAATIYFISLPNFGWLLYVIAILLLVGVLFFFLATYVLLGIVPVAIRKVNREVEKYVAQTEGAPAQPNTV